MNASKSLPVTQESSDPFLKQMPTAAASLGCGGSSTALASWGRPASGLYAREMEALENDATLSRDK